MSLLLAAESEAETCMTLDWMKSILQKKASLPKKFAPRLWPAIIRDQEPGIVYPRTNLAASPWMLQA
jgi:hypothetical protein